MLQDFLKISQNDFYVFVDAKTISIVNYKF